jgi:spermidine synthase
MRGGDSRIPPLGRATAETVARAESAVGEVALRRRGDVVELVVGGVFVMDTVDVSTEVELAALPLARHRAPRRVLVGGLGLGFTAAAALGDDRVECLTVVEIAEPLVAWARAGLLPVGLDDERLDLRAGDVADVLAAEPGEWDLVLLDVDNGPGFLVRAENADLYAGPGLALAVAALAPEGLLAIWSSHRAPQLAEALRTLGAGEVEEVCREVHREGRALGYAIYLLHAPGGPS